MKNVAVLMRLCNAKDLGFNSAYDASVILQTLSALNFDLAYGV